MSSLIHYIGQILTWLVSLITYAGQYLWNLLLTGLNAIVNAIPVPEFMMNATNVMSGLPPGVAYVWGIFQIGPGLAILVSAMILRFLIRRIPLIG